MKLLVRVSAAALVSAIALAAPGYAQSKFLLESTSFGRFNGGEVLIVVERAGDEVQVFARNAYRCPVTIDMTYALSGLGTLEGGGTTVLASQSLTRVGRFQTNGRGTVRYHYDFKWTFGRPGAKPDDTVYRLPYAAGQRYAVSQGYMGEFSHRDTYAIDWRMPEGTAVQAARSGLVVALHEAARRGGTAPKFQALEQGNWIVVQHEDGTLGWYFHLQPDGAVVAPGQRVTPGQTLGYSGNTGFSTQPHLHFEVRTPEGGSRYRSVPVSFKLVAHARAGAVPREGEVYEAF